MGKLILDKAAQAGKAVAERFAKVIGLVNINIALTSGLGMLSFDVPSFRQFFLYFYVTRHEVEVSGCGRLNLPFLYAEFRPFD